MRLVLLIAISCFSHLVGCTDRIASATQGFQTRWQNFQGDTKSFPLWSPGLQTKELTDRFEQMHRDRWVVYFTNPEDCGKKGVLGRWNTLYQTTKEFPSWGSRYPHPIAFAYNVATDSYNASIITLRGKQFLAFEAPTKENLAAFYELLTQYKVTDLIRLTPAVSGDKECSFPYWEGHLNIHPKTARQTIELGGRELNYFCTDCWKDHESMDAHRLIALVKTVMSNETGDQMIGVHCRAGVGRTGTFLTAYALISDIDEQVSRGVSLDHLQLSIDKTIWEISLQRAFVVNNLSQYIALYELVDTYIAAQKL